MDAPSLPSSPRNTDNFNSRHPRRRLVIIVGIVGVLVVLIILIIGSVWLLRRSSPAAPSFTGVLPSAEPGQTSPVPTADPLAASPTSTLAAIPASLLVAPLQNNLAVSIRFTRLPQFQLSVQAVSRTPEDPTIQRRAPVAGAPFSVLRVRDEAGGVLYEEPFTTPTQVELVTTAPSSALPVHQLNESTLLMVVAVQADRQPAKVEVVTSDGQVFDERTFNFATLPQRPLGAPLSHLFDASARVAEGQGMWQRITQGLVRIPWVYAQEPSVSPSESPTPDPTAVPTDVPTPVPTPLVPRCTTNCFNIVVIGHTANEVDEAADAAQAMVDALEPWKTYAQSINVIPLTIPAEEDLGCFTIEGVDGSSYPLCPDGASVTGAVTGVQWHTIINVTDVDCNCGTVEDVSSSDVAAIGKNAGAEIIGHEIGHSVGRMVDEYYYQFGVQGGPLGPNCFNSEQSCQETTTDIPNVTCSLGCRATNTWRPSSAKMHSVLANEYGPLETCVMAEQIRKVVGGEQKFGECEVPDKKIDPSPPPAREGDYYGGSR